MRHTCCLVMTGSFSSWSLCAFEPPAPMAHNFTTPHDSKLTKQAECYGVDCVCYGVDCVKLSSSRHLWLGSSCFLSCLRTVNTEVLTSSKRGSEVPQSQLHKNTAGHSQGSLCTMQTSVVTVSSSTTTADDRWSNGEATCDVRYIGPYHCMPHTYVFSTVNLLLPVCLKRIS
jgi:hypothetical protein